MDEQGRLNPASSALHLAETTLNGLLRLDPEFLEALAPLADTVVSIEIPELEQTLWLQIGAEGFTLLDRGDVEALRPDCSADVSFSGSIPAMLRMVAAMRRGASTIGDDVRITGDLSVLEHLRDAFQRLDLDFEELLSKYVGDIAAHEMGRAARAFLSWSRKTRDILLTDTGEYLVEELELSPPGFELEDFAGDVDRLRDDVERLEKRVARLQGKS